MTKILYDVETMKFSTYFESFTKSRLKDCFKENETLVFVVMPGNLAKAVGKGGSNVKKISQKLKKQVKIIEFNEDITKFIAKAIYPVRNVEIEFKDNNVIIHCPDTKTKGLIYGREKERLKSLSSLVKRYFKINEIKIE